MGAWSSAYPPVLGCLLDLETWVEWGETRKARYRRIMVLHTSPMSPEEIRTLLVASTSREWKIRLLEHTDDGKREITIAVDVTTGIHVYLALQMTRVTVRIETVTFRSPPSKKRPRGKDVHRASWETANCCSVGEINSRGCLFRICTPPSEVLTNHCNQTNAIKQMQSSKCDKTISIINHRHNECLAVYKCVYVRPRSSHTTHALHHIDQSMSLAFSLRSYYLLLPLHRVVELFICISG